MEPVDGIATFGEGVWDLQVAYASTINTAEEFEKKNSFPTIANAVAQSNGYTGELSLENIRAKDLASIEDHVRQGEVTVDSYEFTIFVESFIRSHHGGSWGVMKWGGISANSEPILGVFRPHGTVFNPVSEWTSNIVSNKPSPSIPLDLLISPQS
ncbi:MAG TPA: hypothetical protein H9870_03950 [Candidatus Corynebacterium avicola]|uniref:Uncharacterized protein n=1 Tax=Candidatus Corynebacterium avicola TaxID=2838527 RepID=A0A9D1RQ75_9CORY|nr:hypothetical protein [Candidatus Corynebacterium avicola]